MKGIRVLALDGIAASGVEILRSAGVEVEEYPQGLGPAELARALPGFDGLIVRSRTRVTGSVLQEARGRLRCVGRAGSGVDNIDVQTAARLGITVVNAPEGNTIAVCEHTIALILALARGIIGAHNALKDGRWARKEFMGTELYGKTLGVVGYGRIGRGVAGRAAAFGMQVLAYDPKMARSMATASDSVEFCTLEDLLSRAHIVTLHLPLNKETHHLIDSQRLGLMRPDAFLVNAARGGVVDEVALSRALQQGQIAGAALDVYSAEPPEGNPLIGLPNVVHTPHLGASTRESQQRVANDVARDMLAVLRGEEPRYRVA